MPRVPLESQRKDAFLEAFRELQQDVQRLKTSFANKMRLIEQASQPTLSVEGEVLLWRRTGDGVLFLMARAAGTDRKVQLS
jgi:hypothetical protein